MPLSKKERMIRLWLGAVKSPKTPPALKKALRLKLKELGVKA